MLYSPCPRGYDNISILSWSLPDKACLPLESFTCAVGCCVGARAARGIILHYLCTFKPSMISMKIEGYNKTASCSTRVLQRETTTTEIFQDPGTPVDHGLDNGNYSRSPSAEKSYVGCQDKERRQLKRSAMGKYRCRISHTSMLLSPGHSICTYVHPVCVPVTNTQVAVARFQLSASNQRLGPESFPA